jgi:O-antigen ligase
MVVLFFWVNSVKEKSYRNIGGARLIHSQKMRVSRWVSIFEGIEKRPILGVGFRSAVLNIPVIRTYSGEITSMHSAHNDYIDLLLRGGTLYSFIFWAFVLVMVSRGFRRVDHENEVFHYISLSMAALLIGSLTQNLLKDPFTASFFWIYIAAIGDFAPKRIIFVKQEKLRKHAHREFQRI